MAEQIRAAEQEQDVELADHGDEKGFDNLLADEVVVEWLMQLEQEQNLRAVAG
ncbi:hypothetical protein [Wenzhouxiangella sp. EGI_FJ10305]|uniref:hypothetical protein n=1 Tax=Wenzhouxiangella sp. EGI_FJ10305 TaxID=3243768 RepID=UPI0035D798F3